MFLDFQDYEIFNNNRNCLARVRHAGVNLAGIQCYVVKQWTPALRTPARAGVGVTNKSKNAGDFMLRLINRLSSYK
jgi:hypothetical protein